MWERLNLKIEHVRKAVVLLMVYLMQVPSKNNCLIWNKGFMRPHVFCLEYALLMLEEFEHHIKLVNQVLQLEKIPRLDSRQQTFDVLPSDVS